MKNEVFLEPVPGADISIARCSVCGEEFHSSPIGPRKCMAEFWKHIEDEHPTAVYKPDLTRLFWKK